MAGDTRVPKAEINGIYGAVLKRMTKRMFGQVPDALGVMWHHRPALSLGFALSRKTAKWNKCDKQLKAFAHMATVSMVGCSFCLDLGYFMTRHDGLDVVKAREVPRWRESAVFTPLERDVMEYAEAMSQTPPAVTDELSARLLGRLGAPAMVELTFWIALANQAARTNIALGIEAEGLAATCGLAPIAPRSGIASQV
jgi:alkylhydroperoxidase family enzyme